MKSINIFYTVNETTYYLIHDFFSVKIYEYFLI